MMIEGAAVCPHCRLRQDGKKDRSVTNVILLVVGIIIGIPILISIASAILTFLFLAGKN
jgi:hypothetical protein